MLTIWPTYFGPLFFFSPPPEILDSVFNPFCKLTDLHSEQKECDLLHSLDKYGNYNLVTQRKCQLCLLSQSHVSDFQVLV